MLPSGGFPPLKLKKCNENKKIKASNDKGFFYSTKSSVKERTHNRTIENNHPTVKNMELMKYLIKLITPKDGIVYILNKTNYVRGRAVYIKYRLLYLRTITNMAGRRKIIYARSVR